MEYGQDSEPNADVRFISNHIPVFSPEECSFPAGSCSLVATAPKFGRIFVACRTQIKVFDSKAVWDGPAGSPLTTLNVEAQVTHLAVSCDGLTLLVIILHDQTPHALFYEIRGLVPNCGQQTPLVSMALTGAGSQVHALAWNPTDPGSVAVALSPSSLLLLTLKEDRVESKSENIEARALGWSPKGKQLTVGLEDGTLKLFKPDLTAVRNIQRPPMDEAGAVLSVTWFNNTEFFIGYKSSVEEGAHVIMYINAPKAKEPKFVAYEYVCNYNQGPRVPMFYPYFFPEWSLLCLLSSRAVAMAVLGRPGGCSEGWCEYEIDEGCIAAVHNVSITEETFPLGLAVDFTSQKTFTAKDNKVSGPCPVLCTLSTGGELNLFHMVNEKPGAELLAKPPESLPTTGLRTPQQFGRLVSYPMNKVASSLAPTTFPVPQTAPSTTQTTLAPSPSPAPQQKVDTLSFNPQAQISSPFSASPLQSLGANFKSSQTQSSSITANLFPKSEPASASFFNVQGQNGGIKTAPTAPATTFKPHQSTTTAQDFKFLNCPLPQPSTKEMAGSPVAKADSKPPCATITVAAPKPPDAKPLTVGPFARPPQAVVAELDETLLSTIDAARTDFERELEDQKNMGDLPNQIGEREEMGGLRCSLGDAAEWVDQMNSTTSELKGEVGQLHSEVLEGFTLAEEAEALVIKNKNPRHRLALLPQNLDPHSRKQMEEIRSRYQYLQSQLSEIDTRLHLDWAAYRNEQNKKKKKELPASETLYQALKKCHYARKVCERRVDGLCERIKDLHLHSLSGLTTSQTHQDDDEILDSLERSLRETSISAPSYTSPFNMLSPGKQKSLQKALSQRNFIPLRKCSRSPRLNMSSLENLSPGHSQQASHHSSFSANAGQSLMESFGPQTFSTPMRNNSIAAQTRGISEASIAQASEAASTGSTHKPQYEDITPPQTPDNRLIHNAKPASPLRALSRLVSEVPTTGTSDSKAAGISLLPEGKTVFRGFGDGGSSPSGLKIPVTVASGPPPGAFKPVTSASFSKATLAFPFTQFNPPSTAAQGSAAPQSISQNRAGGSGLLFQPPPLTSENASFSHTASSEISQKTDVKSGLFFNPPVSISESHTQVFDKLETSVAPLSKPSSNPQASGSDEQSVSETGDNTTRDPANASQMFTSMPLHPSTAETDSVSSSSSADSDTASNTTVIGDSTEGLEPPSEKMGNTATGQGSSLRSALDYSSNDQNNASCLKQPSSNTQPSSFLATSGSLFGSSSGMIFGGSSSSNSSFFGTKTSVDSGNLVSSTTATLTTTSTAAPVSVTTTTLPSENLYVAPSTVSGNFFAAVATTASGSVVTTSMTVSGSLFGAQPTTPSSKGLLGSTTTTTATIPVAVMTSAIITSTTLGTSTSTTGSIFGTAKPTGGGTVFEVPTTSGGGIFGASPTTTGSVFGSVGTSSGSIFGTAGSTAGAGSTFEATYANNETSVRSVFGSTATPTEPTSNSATLISATTDSGSIFGTTSTAATNSIFGSSATAVATTNSGSIFGISTTASGGIFGATSTSGSLFSSAPTTTTGSIFGTPTNTSTEGIFGSSTSNTSGGSIFGTPAKTDKTTPSIFGLAKNGTGSLFGGTANSGASTTSTSTTTSTASTTSSAPVLTMGLFSAPPAGGPPSFNLSFASGGGSAISTASTLFSTQTTTSTSGTSFSAGGIFSALSTTCSAFTSLTTSSSAFTSPGSSTSPSLTPSTITTATTSCTVFGQGSQNTPGSMFGSAPSPQGSLFGGGGQSTGGFGTSTLAGGIFGGSGGQSLFGNTSSGSLFSQTSAANTPSPFSAVSTSKAESSPFGGSSVFGAGGGGGGGFFSGLGSKPSAENANKNVFGTTSLSNAAPQTSLFGNNSSTSPFQSSVFGGGNTSGSNGTGSFSGGGGPVANTGFAVTSPQTPPAFGGTATFGGSPSFGGGPTFGSPPRIASQSPVFGGSTFSSPLSSTTGGGFSVFASSSGATFGSIAGSTNSGASTGFGSFANQNNTATFGSLAQQSNNQSSGGAFGAGGGASFGSGSSFSSWR